MVIKTETVPHDGGFLVSEASGTRSREAVTLISGQNLLAGSVLGKITASGKYTQLNPGASDGSEAAAAILFGDSDASAADLAVAAIVRDSEVHKDELVWPSGISGGQKTTALGELLALGIVARSGPATVQFGAEA